MVGEATGEDGPSEEPQMDLGLIKLHKLSPRPIQQHQLPQPAQVKLKTKDLVMLQLKEAMTNFAKYIIDGAKMRPFVPPLGSVP